MSPLDGRPAAAKKKRTPPPAHPVVDPDGEALAEILVGVRQWRATKGSGNQHPGPDLVKLHKLLGVLVDMRLEVAAGDLLGAIVAVLRTNNPAGVKALMAARRVLVAATEEVVWQRAQIVKFVSMALEASKVSTDSLTPGLHSRLASIRPEFARLTPEAVDRALTKRQPPRRRNVASWVAAELDVMARLNWNSEARPRRTKGLFEDERIAAAQKSYEQAASIEDDESREPWNPPVEFHAR